MQPCIVRLCWNLTKLMHYKSAEPRITLAGQAASSDNPSLIATFPIRHSHFPPTITPPNISSDFIDWSSKVYHPTKHIIGHIADGISLDISRIFRRDNSLRHSPDNYTPEHFSGHFSNIPPWQFPQTFPEQLHPGTFLRTSPEYSAVTISSDIPRTITPRNIFPDICEYSSMTIV